MKKLPENVKLRGPGITGLTATLIYRSGNICLFKRSDQLWEVFIVKIEKAKVAFGKQYEKREVYPSNEAFGSSAWCFSSKKNAEKKYKVLVEYHEKMNDQS